MAWTLRRLLDGGARVSSESDSAALARLQKDFRGLVDGLVQDMSLLARLNPVRESL
jgi:hypothetical protein